MRDEKGGGNQELEVERGVRSQEFGRRKKRLE